jgi:hypothetical protein
MLPSFKGRLIGGRSRKRGTCLAITIADFYNKIGTSLQFAATQQFGRFRTEADIRRAAPAQAD